MATSDPTALVVPQMGVVEEVVVIEWLAENGAIVAQGEPVVVLETDKAETELETPASGRLHILVQAGDDTIPVGTTLAHVFPQ